MNKPTPTRSTRSGKNIGQNYSQQTECYGNKNKIKKGTGATGKRREQKLTIYGNKILVMIEIVCVS